MANWKSFKATYMIDKIQGPATAGKEASLPGLKKVCAEFEAIFLNYMMKAMRSSLAGGGIFGKSHQGEIMGSLMDEKMATDIAKKRGIGIGDLLYQKLQGRLSSSHESLEEKDGTRNDSDH
jgi:Rod binding domain-containing protein